MRTEASTEIYQCSGMYAYRSVCAFLSRCFLVYVILSNTASPNASAQVSVPSSISTNTTWTPANNPYVANNDVTVQQGVTLTIEPGVVVKFGQVDSLYVEGELIANGSEGTEILFTSIKDDSDGHDTNGDGTASEPEPRDWGGLSFRDTCTGSLLHHVVVKYGGREWSFPSWQSVPAISVLTSNLSVTNSTITENGNEGIYIFQSNPMFQNNVITDNGGDGFFLSGASPTIFGNIIARNGDYGIRVGGPSANPQILGNSLEDNTRWAICVDPSTSGSTIQGNELSGPRAGILVRAGELTTNTVWNSDSVYVINYYRDSNTMNLTIAEGATLIIEPGRILKFEENARMFFYGDLIAQGTPEEQIVFTSLKDDSHGGDTNGDGNLTTPAKNDWGGTLFWNTCTGSLMESVIVKYAGRYWNNYYYARYPAIIAATSEVEIRNCTVSDNGQDGIYISSASPIIEACEIANNERDGLRLYAAIPLITGNRIEGNSAGISHTVDSGGSVYLNSFLNNTVHVNGQTSFILWSSPDVLNYSHGGSFFRNYLGNYWDDYEGIDPEGDGIGFPPYGVGFGVDYDDYPLMMPSENYAIGEGPSEIWKGAHPENYSVDDRENTYDIAYVVIHTTEASYASAIDWFAKSHTPYGLPPSSAHYVVNKEGTEITQMVLDKDIAYHAGNWHYNTLSIGIEHEGYANDPDWVFSEEMYNKSASLVRFLCDQYGISKDRAHIIGHNQILATKSDPGRYWDWNHYMDLIRGTKGLTVTCYCPVDIVIVDPDGLSISKESNEISDAIYIEADFDGDGSCDDQINIAERKAGDYFITIEAESDAMPAETYTLEISAEHITTVLANNTLIKDIPSQPYIIRSTGNELIPIFPATVDFEPDTFNLGAKGKSVTVYIELPGDLDVSQIDVSTLTLNDTVVALPKPFAIGDYDEDKKADLMVKFDRQQVIQILDAGEKTINITGRLTDGTLFAGTDTIIVIGEKSTQEESEMTLSELAEAFLAMETFDNEPLPSDDPAGEDDGEFAVEEVIAFTLYETGEIIKELGPESFAHEGLAIELAYAIDDVFSMLDEGMYYEALDMLEIDILKRIDGCAITGQPDEDDWIISFEGQEAVYPLVLDTIELLESLI